MKAVMQAHAWDDVRRLLIVGAGSASDVLQIDPALRAMRRTLPETVTVLLTSPVGREVTPLLPWMDAVLVYEPLGEVGRLNSSRETRDLIATLRERAFDAAIIFAGVDRSPYLPAYICYLAGIPIRLGMSREFAGGLLDPWVRTPAEVMTPARHYRYLLLSAGLAIAGAELSLRIPTAARQAASRWLERMGKRGEPFILMASTSRGAEDLSSWAIQGARRLAAALEFPVLVATRQGLLHWIGLAPTGADDTETVTGHGGPTIPELAALMEDAPLVLAIGRDLAPVAEALARPVLNLPTQGMGAMVPDDFVAVVAAGRRMLAERGVRD